MSDPDGGDHRPRHRRTRRGRRRVSIVLSAMALTLAVILIPLAIWADRSTQSDAGGPVAARLPTVASPTPSTSDSGIASPTPLVSPSVAPPTPTPTRPAPTTVGPARPATTGPAPAPGNAGYEAQVVTLVNQERAKAGCGPLSVDSRLTAAARGHSQDMAARGYFDHNTPEGVTPWTRITDAGYHFRTAAENIAAGQATPAAVMDAWMNSAGHRENILNCALRDIGIGLAYNTEHRPYWTQDFGTPA